MTYIISPDATIADMVTVYNAIRDYNGEKTVKTFKDRPTACSRLLNVANDAPKKILRKQSVLVSADDATPTPAPAPAPTKSAAKSAAPAPTKKTGPRTKLTGSTFTVLTSRIPARPNSTLFHCFAFIAAAKKAKDDITVGEVYAAYNKDEDRQYRSNTDYMSSRTFKIAAAKGFIEIHG